MPIPRHSSWLQRIRNFPDPLEYHGNMCPLDSANDFIYIEDGVDRFLVQDTDHTSCTSGMRSSTVDQPVLRLIIIPNRVQNPRNKERRLSINSRFPRPSTSFAPGNYSNQGWYSVYELNGRSSRVALESKFRS